jgi:hypothetical protein
MNERLQQLASKAGHYEFNKWDYFDIGKFAELIVKECAGRVDHILRERQAGGGTMGDDIREHFGVEE